MSYDYKYPQMELHDTSEMERTDFNYVLHDRERVLLWILWMSIFRHGNKDSFYFMGILLYACTRCRDCTVNNGKDMNGNSFTIMPREKQIRLKDSSLVP
jgi:hypothetical protein